LQESSKRVSLIISRRASERVEPERRV